MPATSCKPARSGVLRPSADWPAASALCRRYIVADAVAIGRLSAPANTVTRPSVSIRTDISAPTRLRLCGAHLAGQQAGAGNAHFGFRRGRDHGAVGVAHDDVAQAQGGAAVLVALDLGTADRDGLIAAEILLDRRLQPWRRDVEFDRPARETPPQAGNRDRDDREGERRAPEDPPHERPAQKAGPRRGAVRSTAGGQNRAPHDERSMMRSMARARRVVGWMPMIVVARCHALWGAPRPAHCAYIAAGREFVQRGPWHVSVEPLAPTRRKWQLPTLTGRKRRKEGIWRRELVAGAKAPGVHLATRRRDDGIVEGFQGP